MDKSSADGSLMNGGTIPLRREPSNLAALLTSTLDPLRRQAEGLEVGFRIEAADNLPKDIWFDPEKIAWAIAALIGNSLRYVRRGTRRMPGGSILVRLSVDAARGQVLIVVKDDGPGIPAEKLQHLFRRAAGEIHAAGLALMLIRDVFHAHGGTINVQSSTDAIDHGTTVTLTLPLRP